MQRVISDDDLPSLVSQGEEVLDSSDEILSDQESSRNRLYYSMRRLVHAIATQRALVLVLDDLHWAPKGSCEFIHTCDIFYSMHLYSLFALLGPS
jgi:predicted ATPase